MSTSNINPFRRLLNKLSSNGKLGPNQDINGNELDPLKHLHRNGNLTLEQYLASIGIQRKVEVWCQVDDFNGEAEGDAYLDAVMDSMECEMDWHLSERSKLEDLDIADDVCVDFPLPNEKIILSDGTVLDNLGPCDVYTVIDSETQVIIGDAILIKGQNRWIMDYDSESMGCTCN